MGLLYAVWDSDPETCGFLQGEEAEDTRVLCQHEFVLLCKEGFGPDAILDPTDSNP